MPPPGAGGRLITSSMTYAGASIVATGLAFLTLPLTTLRLDAADFGLFALLTTAVSVGTALSTLGSGFVLARAHASQDGEQWRQAVTSLAVAASASVLLLSAVTLGVGALLGPRWNLPGHLVLLTAASLLVAPFWSLATDVLVILGRPRWYAAVTITQAVTSTAAVLLCLFWLDLGVTSLFVGQLVGSWTAATGAALVLQPHLSRHVERRRLAELSRTAPRFGVGQLLDAAQQVVERTLLASVAGLTGVGIYSHAQRYRGFALMAVAAAGRASWPVTLDEARAGAGFPRTWRAWGLIQTGVGLAGAVFVVGGDALVALLTNDRLTAAAPYAAVLIGITTLQGAAKPELAMIYTRGDGRTAARIGIASGAASLVATAALVPLLGLVGAVLAAGVHVISNRLVTIRTSRRFARLPLMDLPAMTSAAVIAIMTAVQVAGRVDAWSARGSALGLGVTAIIAAAALQRRRGQRARSSML